MDSFASHALGLEEYAEAPKCTHWLWISVPDDLGWLSELIGVGYSMVPPFFLLYLLVYNLWNVRRGWPTGDYLPDRRTKEDVILMGNCFRALKLIGIFASCLILALVEQGLFGWIRLTGRHCFHQSTFPSGTAMFTVALLAVLKVDLDFSLSMPHLVFEEMYTEAFLNRLGYRPIGMEAFFKWSLVLLLTLIPPAVAVFALGNAGFADDFGGVLEGIVAGMVYHVLWMWHFKKEGRLDEVEEKIIIPILHKIHTRAASEMEAPLLSEADERASTRGRCTTEAIERITDTMRKLPEEKKLKRVSLPGLEFFHVRMDSVINQVLESFGGLKEAKDGLQRKQKDLSNELEQMKQEFQLQMENEKKEAQQQMDEARAKSKKEVEEMKLANRLKLEQERKEVQEQHEIDKKALAEKHESEMQKHKEELAKKDEFSRHLVASSETLTQMTKAMEAGDWPAMDSKYSELKEMQRQMQAGGENKQLSKMLASITPIFDGKLLEVEEKKRQWRRWVKIVSEQVEKAEAESGNTQEDVVPLAKELFKAVSEMIRNGLMFEKADSAIQSGLVPDAGDQPFGKRVETFLADRWQATVAKNREDEELGMQVKELQDLIIRKAVWSTKQQLGSFDFTDLESCCEAVDVTNKSFLEKARELINKRDAGVLPGALGQLGTMLYFLEHLELEDQEKCKKKFEEQLSGLLRTNSTMKSGNREIIEGWVRDVAEEYTPESALLQGADLDDIANREVSVVIDAMKSPARAKQCEPLGDLYGIFVALADAWQKKFDVLAVPHHTQVFSLMVFRRFLEASRVDKRIQTLIGQVGTGEGKSMLIAELAAMCAKQGKKVHVIGTDPKLVVRDFSSFRELFKQLGVSAVVCSDPRDDETEADIVQRIPDEAQIVFCEPKHATSFYASKAREGEVGEAVYKDRVLILDEVDALVVDEEPTQAFTYNVGWKPIDDTSTISDYVSRLMGHLIKGYFAGSGAGSEEDLPPALRPPPPPEKEGQQPEEKRQIFDEAFGLFKQLIDFLKKPQEEQDLAFRKYEGDYMDNGINLKGKYVHVVNGKPNVDAKTNFLECLHVYEMAESDYQMRWFQTLFVMSKPRVFRQYENIMGFSGTIGNQKEQKFFRDSYGAEFFLVPPFLSTCTDKENPDKEMFHTANWAGSEKAIIDGKNTSLVMYDGITDNGRTGPCVVVDSFKEQYDCVKGLALKARQHVPVLIIAKDTDQCTEIVKGLRKDAAITNSQDLIRSLSQSDYDRNPSLYKESLKKSTQAMAGPGAKQFRITVTDPSGARGTDYQMRDEDPDKLGGLMLIVLHIPLSERDWVQYKGRTARQKWRGQYCAVLQAHEYKHLEEDAPADYEVKEALPPEVYEEVKSGGMYVAPNPEKAEKVAKQILAFGGEQAEGKLRKTRAVYNAGFIANEICEEVWRIWPDTQVTDGVKNVDIKLRGASRGNYLQICQDYRYLAAEEIEELSKGIAENRTHINWCLKDTKTPNTSYTPEERPREKKKKKAVLFVMDVSFSMQGDRLDTCKEQMKQLLTNKGFIGEEDFVGVVAYGKGHKELLPLGTGEDHLEQVKSLVDEGKFEAAMGDMDDRKNDSRLGLSTWTYQTLNYYVPWILSDKWVPLKTGDDDDDEEEMQRCLVLLCDGGDARPYEFNSTVKKMKEVQDRLALVIITVGNDNSLKVEKPKMQQLIDLGSRQSAMFEADDPAKIAEAFKAVQAALSFSGGVGIVES